MGKVLLNRPLKPPAPDSKDISEKGKICIYILKSQKEYLSFLSSSLSSCRQSGLPVAWPVPMDSGMEGGLQGLLRGVEVKQLLGLELGRSTLTGVGLMRREGLVALNTFKNIIIIIKNLMKIQTGWF